MMLIVSRLDPIPVLLGIHILASLGICNPMTLKNEEEVASSSENGGSFVDLGTNLEGVFRGKDGGGPSGGQQRDEFGKGNDVTRNKIDKLGEALKRKVNFLRSPAILVDLVFLVDSSASVGYQNFNNEIKFIRKVRVVNAFTIYRFYLSIYIIFMHLNSNPPNILTLYLADPFNRFQ